MPRAQHRLLLKAAVAIFITLSAWLAAAVEVRYEYDEAGRLRRVINADTSQTRYTLDAAGNRVQTQATLGAGLVQFAVASATVPEGSGQYTITVARTVKSAGAISVAYATQNVSAQAGVDYTAVSGTLSWANGDASSRTITVPIVNNQLFQPVARSFDISLNSPTGGALLDGKVAARISIADDDPVFFAVSAPVQVNEGGGSVPVTITKSGGVTTQVYSVSYAINSDGIEFDGESFPATAGRDYTASSRTLTFAANQSSQAVAIPILNDATYETNELFGITLSNPTGGTSLGQGRAVIAILEDDPAPVFSLGSDISVNENSGAAVLTVTKTGATELRFRIPFIVVFGTAGAEDLLIPEAGTAANFEPGDTTGFALVELLDDTIFEGDVISPGHETFQVKLATPPFGGRLGRSSATVTILENEVRPPSGYLSIELFNQVSEAAGAFNVPVERIGGTFGAASARCSVRAGTATLGVHFTVVTTSLSWANGEAGKKNCQFTTINNQVYDPTLVRGFGVDLVDITVATDPGGFQSAAVTIVDDEPPPDTAPPAAPTLNAPFYSVGFNEVLLTCTTVGDFPGSNSTGIAGYRLYRDGVLLSQINAALQNQPTQSFVDRSPVSSATHTYTVTSFDGAGNESARSNARQVVVPDFVPPPALTITSLVRVSGTRIDISWTPVTDSAGGTVRYQVVVGGDNTRTPPGGITTTSFSDSIAQIPGATLRYQVGAIDSAANTTFSAEASIVLPAAPVPEPPVWTPSSAPCLVENAPTCRTNGPIPLAWLAVPTATYYEVEYAAVEDTSFTLLATTTATGSGSPGLHGFGIQDRYRVRACNQAGCGQYSPLIYWTFSVEF